MMATETNPWLDKDWLDKESEEERRNRIFGNWYMEKYCGWGAR